MDYNRKTINERTKKTTCPKGKICNMKSLFLNLIESWYNTNSVTHILFLNGGRVSNFNTFYIAF